MAMHTSIALLCFHLALTRSYAPPQSVSKQTETIIDLKPVAGRPRNTEPTHIVLSARDWNGPDSITENVYFLVQDNVRYMCTARNASLCPKMFGREWIKADNKLLRLANSKHSGEKLTMTKGSLEYSCFTLFPHLCPIVPGGVWRRKSIEEENGITPEENRNNAKPRANRSPHATVSCYSKDLQICRNIRTDDSWVIKRRRSNGEAPGVWMRNVGVAELFCSSLDVGSCPFNDGKWFKVAPSNTIPSGNVKGRNNRQGSDASTMIDNYRRQKKIYDIDEEVVSVETEYGDERDSDGYESRHEHRHDIDRSRHESDESEIDQHDSDEHDSDEHDSDEHDSDEHDSDEHDSDVHERKEGNTDDKSHINNKSGSSEEGWGHYTNNGEIDQGYMITRTGTYGKGWTRTKHPKKQNDLDQNKDQSEDEESSEDVVNGDHTRSPHHQRSKKKIQTEDVVTGVTDKYTTTPGESITDYSKGIHTKIKEWFTKMGGIELICRAQHKRLCPNMRHGKKGRVKWHKLGDLYDDMKLNMQFLFGKQNEEVNN